MVKDNLTTNYNPQPAECQSHENQVYLITIRKVDQEVAERRYEELRSCKKVEEKGSVKYWLKTSGLTLQNYKTSRVEIKLIDENEIDTVFMAEARLKSLLADLGVDARLLGYGYPEEQRQEWDLKAIANGIAKELKEQGIDQKRIAELVKNLADVLFSVYKDREKRDRQQIVFYMAGWLAKKGIHRAIAKWITLRLVKLAGESLGDLQEYFARIEQTYAGNVSDGKGISGLYEYGYKTGDLDEALEELLKALNGQEKVEDKQQTKNQPVKIWDVLGEVLKQVNDNNQQEVKEPEPKPEPKQKKTKGQRQKSYRKNTEKQLEFIRQAFIEGKDLAFVMAFSLAGSLNRITKTSPSILVIPGAFTLARLGANLYVDSLEKGFRYPTNKDLYHITLLCDDRAILKTADTRIYLAVGQGKVKKDVEIERIETNLIMTSGISDKRVLKLEKAYEQIMVLSLVDTKKDIDGYGAYWDIREDVDKLAKENLDKVQDIVRKERLEDVENLALPILLAYLVFGGVFGQSFDYRYALERLREHQGRLYKLRAKAYKTFDFWQDYLRKNWKRLLEEGVAFKDAMGLYIFSEAFLKIVRDAGFDEEETVLWLAKNGLIVKSESKEFRTVKWINGKAASVYWINENYLRPSFEPEDKEDMLNHF